jgi:hypothetical protein
MNMGEKLKSSKVKNVLTIQPTQLRFQFEQSYEKTAVDDETCPVCGTKLIKAGCWRCPTCNFSSCGL